MPSFCKSCAVLETVCLPDTSVRAAIPARLRITVADAGSAGFAFQHQEKSAGKI